MEKKDVVAILGKPNAILARSSMMKSTRWKCSNCQEVHDFDEPVRPPAPCYVCGGIAFEKMAAAPITIN